MTALRLLLRTHVAASALFILMESVAWWIGLRAIASGITREGYASMAERLEQARGGIGDPIRVQRAIEITRQVASEGMGGPPFLVVLIAAAGAFVFVRWLTRQQLPPAITAVIGVAASLVAFQVLVRISLAGDLRVWEAVPVLQASVQGQAGTEELRAFVADPRPQLPVRGALTMGAGGLGLLWLRFLVAGRTPVTYERVLRSFGAGFAILLVVTAWVAVGEHVDVAIWVPMYFVTGVAALAVAQAARARPTEDATGRVEPWVTSLGVTLVGIAAIAAVFAFLTVLDGGRLMEPLIAAVVWLVTRIAWLVLYPFAVVMQAIVSLILGGRTLHLDQFSADLLQPIQPPPTGQPRDSLIPGWLAFLLRTAIILVTGWVMYRVGRVVFAARRRYVEREQGVEVRGISMEEAPSGLFRGLFGRGRRDTGWSGDWLRRHAVYELFARVVQSARERGVERTPGSTPLEFAHDAGVRLDAPPFEPIGRAFDEARYGRHFPERGEIEAMERSLREWERSHVPRPPEEAREAAEEQ